MNLKILSLLIIEVCILLPDVCYAFFSKDVHLLNMQNGLADNTVSAVYKDKEGFVWFGTRNGLSRYDGRRITNFEISSSYPSISNLKEAFDGVLAFVDNGVFSAFDLKKERFLSVVSSSGQGIPSRGMLQKNDSLVWVISGSELHLMKRCASKEGELRLRVEEKYTGWDNQDNLLVAITYSSDKKSICLIDEKGRIILLDATNLSFFRVIDLGRTGSLSVNSVLYDDGRIWISTIAHGVIYYNERTGKIKQLTYHVAPVSDKLSHTDVFGVIKLNENRYLAVTWNGYTVMTIDKNNQDGILTEIYSNTSSLMHRNLETRMIAAYYDSHGILWIGTDGGGVIWSDLRMQFYNRFYQDRHNEICSIVADDDHYLWLATYHKGIMRSRTAFGTSEKIDFFQVGDQNVKKQQTVLCSLKDEKGNLWFGNLDGSLTCYYKKERSFKILRLITENGDLNKSSVWALFLDSKGHFWIGTHKGLWLFDRETNRCKKMHFKVSGLQNLSPLYIRAMAETDDHTLWLGTANYGICKVINENELQTGYEKKYGMVENSVRSLLASSDGNLYVGYMAGLAVFSPGQDAITHVYTTRDGLCSNFIGCMTEDAHGQIWLGSNSGISRYSRHQHLFYNYYIAGSNRSVLHWEDVLFWGNNKNLTYFNPDDIKAFTTSESVVITGLEVNNKLVEIGREVNGQTILSQSIFYTPFVRLNHANRDFALTFNNLSKAENTPLFSNKVGIGLRIVKNTMDLHHGTVNLDSTLGKGSTFTLLIPEGNAHFAEDRYEIVGTPEMEEYALPLPIMQAEGQEDKPSNKKTSLLVIEDNEEIRHYVCSLFCKDYAVYEAANGEEGGDVAMSKIPDLIISDIMMPVKDGFTCCRELREQPRTAHIPILMLTAKAEDADVLQASKIGVDDYMMKPFNPEVLKAKVRNLILQRERLKRIYTKTLMLKQQESEPETDGNNAPDDFIQQIIHVIEANLANENFNVKMLADQLNMSQPTLYRKIKQRSELAAIDMIRSVRMGKAASLIMENRYSIQEIAEMVGYSDTRTLRKHFTEQFGVSPSKYMEKE